MEELNETTRIPFTKDPAEPEVASATLIIYGEDFEPTDVTRVLGLQPNRTWRKGERKSFVPPDGTQLIFDSLHEWNGWKIWLDESTRERQLCEQLQHWHDLLMPRAAQMRKLRDQGVNIELTCCVITSTATTVHISAPLQAAFSALGDRSRTHVLR
jgi:hypothetical protein